MNEFSKALAGFLVVGVFYFVVMFMGQDEPAADIDEGAALATFNRAMQPVGVASRIEDLRPKVNSEPAAIVDTQPSASRRADRPSEPRSTKVVSKSDKYSTHPDVEKAIRMIDDGNVNQALTLLENVLKDDPENEQALVEMAMIQLLDLRQPEKAITYLERVIRVNPGNRVVMTELVSLYEEEGRVEEGLNFLLDSQNSNPDSGDIAYGVGQMLVMQGRDQDAIQHLRRAADNSDNPVRARRELAEAFSRIGDSEQAVQAYSQAIVEQEKEVNDRVEKGMPASFAEERLNYMKMDMIRELMASGQWERAEKVLSEVENAMPDDESVMTLAERVRNRDAM